MIETDIFALKIRHRVGQLGARSLSSVPRKSACGRLFLSVYLASERLSSLVGGYIGSTISANTLYRGWLACILIGLESRLEAGWLGLLY